MFLPKGILKFASAVVLALVTSVSGAATFSNTADADNICCFGLPDTTSYGQTFNLSQTSVLQDWSFFAAAGNSGNLRLVIAEWDGTKAVGSELYSGSFAYAGGEQTLAFSGINLNLAAGSYISYLTVAGVTGATNEVFTKGSQGDGGLGGGFRFLNTNGADPLTFSDNWDSWYIPNMHFEANITAAVPEPEIYAMMGLGLGLLGWAGRRRRAQQLA